MTKSTVKDEVWAKATSIQIKEPTKIGAMIVHLTVPRNLFVSSALWDIRVRIEFPFLTIKW